MINKLSVTKYKYTLDSNKETERQLATSGGHELVSLLITAGGTSAAARVYDSAEGVGEKSQSILIAANAGESTPYTPTHPELFKKGIYVVMEQGAPGGAELHIAYN